MTAPWGEARTVLKAASRRRWLARRRKGLTATESAVVLGLSPFQTPLGLWVEKVTGEGAEVSWPMRRGSVLEAAVAAEYERETGHRVIRPPLLLAHPELLWLLASLDRLTWDEEHGWRILEIKTSSDWWEWDGGAIPDHIACQVLIQLAVTRLPQAVIFADVNGRLEQRTIDRQPEWEADTLPVLGRWFADHITAGDPPPIDPYRDYALLNRVWQPEPGTEVEADAAVIGSVRCWLSLQANHAERERTLTALKSQVRAYMGTATTLTDPETGARLASITKSGALRIDRPKELTA